MEPLMADVDRRNDSKVTKRLFDLIMKLPEHEQRRILIELENKMIKEKRQFPRKPFFVSVDYADQENFYQDFIRDINPNGVFIDTKKPFSVGKEVTLSFPIPHEQGQVQIKGVIVRVSDRGIGVKFNLTDPCIKEMLETQFEGL
jgi:Tfp pilus assembly protein PilZ